MTDTTDELLERVAAMKKMSDDHFKRVSQIEANIDMLNARETELRTVLGNVLQVAPDSSLEEFETAIELLEADVLHLLDLEVR